MRHLYFHLLFVTSSLSLMCCGNKSESMLSEDSTYGVADAFDDIKEGKKFDILLKIHISWLKHDVCFSTRDSAVWMVKHYSGIPTRRQKLTSDEIDYLFNHFRQFYIDESAEIKKLVNPKHEFLPNNINWGIETRILLVDSLEKPSIFELPNEYISEQWNYKVQIFSDEFLSFYNFLARIAEKYYLSRILPFETDEDEYVWQMENLDLEYHQDIDYLNSL